jgi:O-antigen/teichoic acid export membrane protein
VSTSSQPELRGAAIGSLITLVCATFSAAAGFTFSVVLARGLGAEGAGVVLQAIACFTIALGVGRLGLDTTAVWLLPRLRSQEPHLVRPALTGLLLPALLGSTVLVLAWLAVAAVLAATDVGDPSVLTAISVTAAFLPFAAVMTVALAATRAWGGVIPFNVIGNVVVPGVRPLALGGVLLAGSSALAASVTWAAAWLVGAVLAVAVLSRLVRRTPGWREPGGSWRPDRALRRRIRGFALPRVLASAMEQSITWLDVILVGVLIGSTAAGVYGTVARFVTAGALVATALRIVVAPRFSALLGEGRGKEVEGLYAATAQWILLLGAPAYVTLAVFSPTVLGWLGEGFEDGLVPMVVLCAGALVVLAAGNVQALLLMSGRSAASAVNKAVVLTFNVVGNLILVPRVGITGAAAVWSASMVLDTALAVWQVRRHVGVSVSARSIGSTGLAVGAVVGVPCASVALVLGQGTAQLLLAVLLSGLGLLGYCLVRRKHLRLDVLRPQRASRGDAQRDVGPRIG